LTFLLTTILETEFASDIAWVYGTATSEARWKGHTSPPKAKKVILLSSSRQILPRFNPWLHEEGVRSLNALGVEVITGTRADMSTLGDVGSREKKTIKTLDGRKIEADVVLLCTGQKSNTDYLKTYGNVLDEKTGMASVTPHLQLREQVDATNQTALNHIFVVGDAADAFGALNAGHNAGDQARLASRNIGRLVAQQEGGNAEAGKEDLINTPLETYTPGPRKIKVSVGIDRAVGQLDQGHKLSTDGVEDLNVVKKLWVSRGLDTSDLTV
jgi:NADH dehydrogenase FAD-containing subunit